MVRVMLVYTVTLVVLAFAGSGYAAYEALRDGYWGLALVPLIPAAVVARVCWLMWQDIRLFRKLTPPTVKKM